MPEVVQPATDEASVLERVKKAEMDAKSKLEQAASQAETVKADARAEGDRIVGDAEAAASKLRLDIVGAGRADTEKVLDSIRQEAADGAERIRRQKEKKVAVKEIIESVLKV